MLPMFVRGAVAAGLLSLAPASPLGAQGADARPTPATQPSGRALAVGEKAQVSWSGGWYTATVLEVRDGGYKVRYDGWSSSWDEWVTPSRMRLPDGGGVAPPKVPAGSSPKPASPAPAPRTSATPPAAPAPPPKVWSTAPAGRWVCRTWDYGQVNRVAEFVLRADGSYQDLSGRGNGSGRYRFDKGTNRITFTSGPQVTRAPVIFDAAGHQGKGHIVFDYGGGAKLDCYREALT